MAASATNFRDIYLESDKMKFMQTHERSGMTTPVIGSGYTRYQWAWVVILHQYDSKFQLLPQRREYFVYAPNNWNYASTFAYELWRKWEKGLRPGEVRWNIDPDDDYPRIADAMVAHPIDDDAYAEAWNFVKKMDADKFWTDGNPNDPIAFTTRDDSVKLFRDDNDTRDVIVSV